MVRWTEEQKLKAGTIGAVLDLDGFRLQGKFLVKELGWHTFGHHRGHAVHFYHDGPNYFTEQDHRCNTWIYHNVYDVPLRSYWFGMIKAEKVGEIVRALLPRPRDHSCLQRRSL